MEYLIYLVNYLSFVASYSFICHRRYAFKYWQTKTKKKRKHICTHFYICSKGSFLFSWTDRPQRIRTSSLLRLHDHTQTYIHSVGPLWMSDQPNAETSTWQHRTLKLTNMHAFGVIRTRNPSNRATAIPHLRARGHWESQPYNCVMLYSGKSKTKH